MTDWKANEKSAERIKANNLKMHTLKVVSESKQGSQRRVSFEQSQGSKVLMCYSCRNDEGRIYGATFIDHTTRTVLNGSRLGKEYSANVFNELYGGKAGRDTRNDMNINLSDVYDNVQPTEKYEDNHIVTMSREVFFQFLIPNLKATRKKKCHCHVARKRREEGMEGRCESFEHYMKNAEVITLLTQFIYNYINVV